MCSYTWYTSWHNLCFCSVVDDYFKNFKRPSMPSKHLSLGESIDKDHINGAASGSVNRTGSSPGLTTHSHTYLQKPVMLRSSSADQPTHPLIVFEKAPNSSRSETSLVARQKQSETKSTKHQKYLKPDCSEDESIPLNLEQIVIHNLPKAPVRRGILRREDTITSTVSSVSEQEQPCWWRHTFIFRWWIHIQVTSQCYITGVSFVCQFICTNTNSSDVSWYDGITV
mgnify:FL=1